MPVSWNLTRFLPPLVVAVILLVLVIGVGAGGRLSGTIFLGVMLAALGLGALLVAVYLWIRCNRPVAASGALITGASLEIAFYIAPQPWLLWTVLFFVGVILIAWDTAKDTTRRTGWPLVLLRVGIGWAWIDNAQDHFWVGQWFVGNGGGFLQTANGAANRGPTYFLDPLYQGFLKGSVVPNADAWAALTACGELTVGLLLAIGFMTPVAAFLSLWLSTNYIMMKSFIGHAAYTDKVFWIAALVLLVTQAGMVYGVDAALQRHVPAWFARWFLGVAAGEGAEREPARLGRPEPQPT
jgi:uncharacterized membrane protein YphA (DoxX/SURF4 family)